jgi:hypothetical protein
MDFNPISLILNFKKKSDMRKTWMIYMVFGLFVLGCQSKDKKTIEGAEITESLQVGYFGEEITEYGITSLQELITILDNEEEFSGKVKGEIKEVCAMKGCWMTIELPNGENMRVTFKDYGFFVPKNSQGFPVVIEGTAAKKVTDVATLKHYAEDAGKTKEEINAINSPKQEYSFEAIGVIIKENA